jgi:hypothetical protein
MNHGCRQAIGHTGPHLFALDRHPIGVAVFFGLAVQYETVYGAHVAVAEFHDVVVVNRFDRLPHVLFGEDLRVSKGRLVKGSLKTILSRITKQNFVGPKAFLTNKALLINTNLHHNRIHNSANTNGRTTDPT